MVDNISDSDRDQTLDFSELIDSSFDFEPPARGDIRDAEILEIRANEIVVDMGAKRDGIIPPQDLERLDPDYLKSLNRGDVIPVYVLNPSDRDGNLLVSLNLGLQGQDWLRARDLLESGEVVEAEIVGYNRGGILVRFGRLEGFIPASHSLDFQQGFGHPDQREAIEAAIGQSVGLKVIEVNQGRRRLILSQREAQRDWRAQQKQRLMEDLAVGDIVTGRVTGVRDFGAFVDLGGADGLIHVSELAWHRVPHPNDVVKIGQEIQVYILELDEEKQRIALSLRRTLPDPWEVVDQNHRVGDVIEGQVSNVVDFGAFVVLDDGIEGLLHVSEMADGSLTEPYSYIKRGDTVMIRIVRIEPDRRRIGFTQKGLGLDVPVDVTEEGEAPLAEVDDVTDTEFETAPVDEPEAEVSAAAELEAEAVDEEPVEAVLPDDQVDEAVDEPEAEVSAAAELEAEAVDEEPVEVDLPEDQVEEAVDEPEAEVSAAVELEAESVDEPEADDADDTELEAESVDEESVEADLPEGQAEEAVDEPEVDTVNDEELDSPDAESAEK